MRAFSITYLSQLFCSCISIKNKYLLFLNLKYYLSLLYPSQPIKLKWNWKMQKWSILKIDEYNIINSSKCQTSVMSKPPTNVNRNTHYLKVDMILPPYCGLNPWSKYVPMPPRQKGPIHLSLTHLWHFVEGWSKRFQKVSARPRATMRVRWTKDVHRVSFRLF